MFRQSMTDRRAMEKARRFTRDNISTAILTPPPTPPLHITAKNKAVFDMRALLPCHVGRSGNMDVAYTNYANGRKIDKYHKSRKAA